MEFPEQFSKKVESYKEEAKDRILRNIQDQINDSIAKKSQTVTIELNFVSSDDFKKGLLKKLIELIGQLTYRYPSSWDGMVTVVFRDTKRVDNLDSKDLDAIHRVTLYFV